jgi:hypothetical protein
MFQRAVKVVLVGAPRTGKSLLHAAMVASTCAPVLTTPYHPTMGVDYGCVVAAGVKLHLWDLGGQARFRAMTTPYYSNVDVVMAVYDRSSPVTASRSLHDLVHDWLQRSELQRAEPRLVYIVGVSPGTTATAAAAVSSAAEAAGPGSRTLAEAVQAALTTFRASARFVVPVDVDVAVPSTVQAFVGRLAHDVTVARAGVDMAELGLRPMDTSPKTALIRHRMRPVDGIDRPGYRRRVLGWLRKPCRCPCSVM